MTALSRESKAEAPEKSAQARKSAEGVPDVRGEGIVPATEAEYQPPKEHLGLNPTNQYVEDPTPTAAPDRSVPSAPVVGDLPREPLPSPGETRQELAQTTGGAWPPIEATPRESRSGGESRSR